MILIDSPGETKLDRGSYLAVRGVVNESVSIALRDQPVFDDRAECRKHMRVARLAAYITAVTLQERQEAATARVRTAREQNRTDPITGLDNRLGYEERVRSGLALAKARNQPATLVVLDLNGIDVVNEQQGRSEGDRWIQETARILSRHSDQRPARWGGDEYGVLRVDADREDTERWWEVVVQNFQAEAVPISAGAAVCMPEDMSTDLESILEDLTSRADQALYAAKEASRGRNMSLLYIQ
jgi:diguanylate cyclase (GGDEF)-like protein